MDRREELFPVGMWVARTDGGAMCGSTEERRAVVVGYSQDGQYVRWRGEGCSGCWVTADLTLIGGGQESTSVPICGFGVQRGLLTLLSERCEYKGLTRVHTVEYDRVRVDKDGRLRGPKMQTQEEMERAVLARFLRTQRSVPLCVYTTTPVTVEAQLDGHTVDLYYRCKECHG